MFRRTYRNFELEATRAREGGYIVRILKKGAIVKVLGENENGRGEYDGPDIALDWALHFVLDLVGRGRTDRHYKNTK